eukprot:5271449-Prymnesium_polylepis.2
MSGAFDSNAAVGAPLLTDRLACGAEVEARAERPFADARAVRGGRAIVARGDSARDRRVQTVCARASVRSCPARCGSHRQACVRCDVLDAETERLVVAGQNVRRELVQLALRARSHCLGRCGQLVACGWGRESVTGVVTRTFDGASARAHRARRRTPARARGSP